MCVPACASVNTMHRWVLLIFVHLSIHDAAAQRSNSALYPSAHRIKRGSHLLIDPTFQHSMADVNLLYEILLSGMQIPDEDHPLLIPDDELASLRSVEKLEVLCEDVLPKRLADVRRLVAELAWRRRPLSLPDFERTVLTLVYTMQTVARIDDQRQREVWTDTLVQLFRAIEKDLRPL